MLDGYAQRLRNDRRGQAWTVSHLLIAAGCEPEKVTPAKLLGEKERRPRVTAQSKQMPIDEIFKAWGGKVIEGE